MESIKYDISKINEMDFDTEEFVEFEDRVKVKSSYKLTSDNIRKMPSKDMDDLRCKLVELFYEKLGNDYNELLIRCDIKSNTFQKMINFKGKNNITYKNLAKFAIGASLSLDETIELFALRGFSLYERNKSDYILICEIVNKGNLIDYDEDMKKYCNKSIISGEDED
jgi:hypothetical protein